MSSVSPSLVEAAARATAPWVSSYGRGDERRVLIAEAVIAAVGDALRLEGAQAEHARVLRVIHEVANGYQYYDLEGFAKAIREALEHPETWVFVPFDSPGEGGVHPEASDG